MLPRRCRAPLDSLHRLVSFFQQVNMAVGALYIVISFKPLGEEWPACPRGDRHSGGSQHNTAKLHARPAANGMSRWRSNGAGK